jgi:hypothetical protein
MSEGLLRDGRYELLGKLGEGAQGTTFYATDHTDGRSVAIKRFFVRGAASWKDVELAEREAAVLSVLSHRLLPQYFDHFEEDGALYLVMERVDGESLAALAKRGGRLSRDDVVQFLRDSAEMLAYLHGRSPPVIHRDINPKNVIRRPDGSFRLVDFGAVRDKLKPEGGSTVVGTFGYMAPEQFQGRALPASDVYAVGVTALRLLTGIEPEHLPHQGLAIDVRSALGMGFDSPLRDVLTRMLETDPDRRASSITPLIAKLDRAAPRPSRESRPSGNDRRTAERDEARARKREREREHQEKRHRAHQDAKDRAHERRREHALRRDEMKTRARDEQRRMQREWSAAGRKGQVEWRDSAEHARQEWEAWQESGQPWRGPRGVLHGPRLIIAVVALNLAIICVRFALIVFVPFILRLLSIFFGRGLRDSARTTRAAGRRARDNLRHARDVLRGVETDAVDPEEAKPPPRARVRVDAESERPFTPPPEHVDAEGRRVVDTTATEIEDEEPAEFRGRR